MPLNFTFAADYAQDFTDTNGDGIPDAIDVCPLELERYNGFQDDDGCPDSIVDNKGIFDTDGDGINDYVDLCTNQPEPFNGVFDRDVAQIININFLDKFLA